MWIRIRGCTCDMISPAIPASSPQFHSSHGTAPPLVFPERLSKLGLRLKLQLLCLTFSEWSITDFSSRLLQRFCNFFFSASASSSRFIRLFRTWTKEEVLARIKDGNNCFWFFRWVDLCSLSNAPSYIGSHGISIASFVVWFAGFAWVA